MIPRKDLPVLILFRKGKIRKRVKKMTLLKIPKRIRVVKNGGKLKREQDRARLSRITTAHTGHGKTRSDPAAREEFFSLAGF